MKYTPLSLAALLFAPFATLCGAADSSQPAAQSEPLAPSPADLAEAEAYRSKGYNVLFIGVDDMNDWVGMAARPMSGSMQAKTGLDLT